MGLFQHPAKDRLKRWVFALLGKEPDAVIVCLRSDNDALSDAMVAEIRGLEPGRRIFEARADESFWALRARFRKYRIGLMPALMPIPRAAWLLAPRRILAYNSRLERHHVGLSIASWLFLRGVPLDRIFLRPFSHETVRPTGHRVIDGRALNANRKTIAVLTPYFPYPLAHGGAVRMFNLLRETAREFNVILYAFTEGEEPEVAPGAGVLLARLSCGEAALSRASLVDGGAAGGGRVFFAGDARVVEGARGRRGPGRVYVSRVVWGRCSGRARCDLRSLWPDSRAEKDV